MSKEVFLEKRRLPTFSIIVPARNEEKVLGRLLDALSKLAYPAEKKEIIVVEDGSTDRTLAICFEHAKKCHMNLKVLQKPFSDGKPSALNYGIRHAKGEVIGIFDADSVPARDGLLNACKYFDDLKVAAVQGRTLSINSDENMLTKFISYEETVWCEIYLRGKDALDLFVHLKGSCQFIRRDVLEKLKGFDENALSEDVEISARLFEEGYKIRYAPEVRSWQENPAKLRLLFSQRIRWFRGMMEVAFRYGRLMTRPNRRGIDAEMTFLGPFMLIASLITYIAASLTVNSSFPVFWGIFTQLTSTVTTFTLLMCSLALIHISKPKRLRNLLWLPFIYFYWSLQALVACYALVCILLHRPRKWVRTEKQGIIACTID